MNARSQILSLALLVALAAALALPTLAAAEYYVPPSNSAANQYTESFPGAGGESGGKRKDVQPGAALGAKNAKQLEEMGPAGRAAAEVAAETAPLQLVASAGEGGSGQSAGTGSKDGDAEGGSGTGGAAADIRQPQGSSGLGQVLGQATGASDGNLGLWLPLAIALMLIAAVAYGVRTRHGQHRHA